MRELCNCIDIDLVSDINIQGDKTMRFFSESRIDLSQKEIAGEYGIRYDLSINVSIEKSDLISSDRLNTIRKGICTVYTLQGEVIKIGSKRFPAQIMINKMLNHDLLMIRFISVKPLF